MTDILIYFYTKSYVVVLNESISLRHLQNVFQWLYKISIFNFAGKYNLVNTLKSHELMPLVNAGLCGCVPACVCLFCGLSS